MLTLQETMCLLWVSEAVWVECARDKTPNSPDNYLLYSHRINPQIITFTRINLTG